MAKRAKGKVQKFFNEVTGTYANQISTKLVKTNENDIKESRGAAFQDLTPAAFGLYIFASMDTEYFDRTWSHYQIQEWCGMPYSTYRKALTELVSKGYIKDGYFYLSRGIENIANAKKEALTLINENHKRESLTRDEEPIEIMKPDENGSYNF